MKQSLTTVVLVTILALLVGPGQLFAQAGDTLVVYALGDPLNAVIARDTISGGAQAHKVYKLVSRDTTYLYEDAITVRSDFTILGVLDPATKRPPCIQPAVLPDQSIPANLFVFVGRGKKAVVKNLYLLALSTNGSANGNGVAIQVSADSISVVVDNVVFEEWQTFAIGYNGNWDKFLITNSKFRNMVHPNQWYIGEVLRNEWPGAAYTDSVIFRYNTMFCINGYASATVTKFYTRYLEFTHNNVIYTFKNPFFEFNTTNGKFNNNLFYAPWAGGIAIAEYPWWDQLWSPEIGSIIDMDTLDLAKDSIFNPSDVGNVNLRMLSEAKRTVEVKNNAYWWPTQLTSYWQAWNDTAHLDSIYTVTWMNTRTTNMFANNTVWPGFVESGNQNVDPVMGTSIPAVLTQATNGLLDWFRLIRTGQTPVNSWGYNRTVVTTAADWKPTWPLPEATDMQYTNMALRTGGTDGLPVGDPNWFGIAVGVEPDPLSVPLRFSLSSAYPNPFNPGTTFTYTLEKAGVVNLSVYNILGQVVVRVVDGEQKAAGSYTVRVDMSHMPSGVYFGLLEQGTSRAIQKMMLLK